LADWSAAGGDDLALANLAQALNRTVRAIQERARAKGLWKSRQCWQPHEIAQIVAWAKVHGTSGAAIQSGLQALGIDQSVGAARYYLYREGVLLKGSKQDGEGGWQPPPRDVPDPEELLPPELRPIWRRLLAGQREVAHSIATYDVPAFVRYVRAAQFWNECPEWQQGWHSARGAYRSRVSEFRQAKTKGAVG